MLDSESRELSRSGKPAHLSPKALELLIALVETRPRALSKAQIHDRLWPGTFVSEANLASLIAELRRALGDRARGSRYVRTVHRFGYAFCAEAEAVPAREAAPPADTACRLIWGRREIALREGENLLGRTQDSAVWLDSSSVSRRHARITVADGMATLDDLGSKNGTRIGGRRITAPTPLVDGDQLRFGSVLMTFRVFPGGGSTQSEVGG